MLQGYYQLAKFHIPLPERAPTPTTNLDTNTVSDKTEKTMVEVEYATISRRSKERAGLRYQRRGIDDDAHVANFVETEAIVRLIVGNKQVVVVCLTACGVEGRHRECILLRPNPGV